MSQALNQILSEIQKAPSQVSQDRWFELVRLLRDEPDQKDQVYAQITQILDKDALAARAYAKWIYALYQEPDPKDAVQIAERADNRYPNNPDILILYGMSLRQAGDTPKAIEKFEQVLTRQQGADFDAHYNLGNALLEADPSKAEQNYRAALSIKATGNAHYGLGLALQKQGRNDEAIAELELARSLNPQDANVYLALGNARLNSDPVAAERDYAESAKIAPTAIAYYNWGIALARNQKTAEAEEKYILATQIDPGYANAFYNLGVLLQNDPKRKKDAQTRYGQAIGANPDHADAHFNLGLLLTDDNKLEEAAHEYDEAIRSKPNYVDAYSNCVRVLIRLERFHEAAERCAKAIELCSEEDSERKATINYFWGLALENDEQIPERDRPVSAEQKYKQAVVADPTYADALFALGNVSDKQRKLKGALANWEAVTRLSPDFAFAWHNIADLYHRQGQYKLSWGTWQRAEQAYRTSASQSVAANGVEKLEWAFFFYVWGTMQQEVFRDLDRAEENYRKACELSPEFSGPRCSLVRLYLEREDQIVDRPDPLNGAEDRLDYRARFATAAWQTYLEADALLDAELKEATSKERRFNSLLQRGELHLAMKDLDEAEKYLQAACRLNDSSPRVWTDLGVLFGRKGDTAKQAEHFEEALRRDAYDLRARCNLANAYQSRDCLDLAETEYKRVLNIADGQIEALIGLGETYVSLAETGDPDLYPKAIEFFEKALQFGSRRQGSRLLTARERGAVHYYLGVAKSRLLEKSSAEEKESWLRRALESFDACCDQDPENQEAARARDKLKSALHDSRLRGLAEPCGSLVVLLPVLCALALIQTSFFFRWPIHHLDPGYYATLSFGLLLFVIAGLYLPQVLKVEVGAVKLEKSVTERVPPAPLALGLKWKVQRLPQLQLYLSSQLPSSGERKDASVRSESPPPPGGSPLKRTKVD